MRRLFAAAGILGLAAAFYQIHAVRSRTIAAPDPAAAATAQAGPEAAPEPFPVGVARTVELDIDEASFDWLSEREQKDQVRDWLLFTVVSSLEDSIDAVSRSLYDLPVVRQGYMRPVSSFDYTDTRSAAIGGGRVVALVPALAAREGGVEWGTPTREERLDALARVADEHRKNAGEVPGELLVFEYAVDLEDGSAAITRRTDIPGKDLYAETAGYLEREIASRDDLAAFMGKVELVTHASIASGKLVVGGRRGLARPHRTIRVEEVAALWQAEHELRDALEAFDKRWKEKEDAFNNKWRYKSSPFGGIDMSAFDTFDWAAETETDPVKAAMKRLQRQRSRPLTREGELAKLQADYDAERRELRLVNGTGFSLDPTYDVDGLSGFFAAVEPALRQMAARAGSTIAATDLDAIARALRKPAAGEQAERYPEVPLLTLVEKLKARAEAAAEEDEERPAGAAGEGEISQLLSQGVHEHRYQAARYDGDLGGTEVGMVLFYTDLLAKLWAMDYLENRLGAHVPDFRALIERRVSPVYQQEEKELSSTRLWFGPEDNGFQVTADKRTLHLAHLATRIYAAGHNELNPGHEVEPNASSEAFLGWWNDHYEEVARYEPEYERLNEIMKWSLIVSWLHDEGRGGALGWLAQVAVDRGAWFPDWARRRPELRFKKWDGVSFHARGEKSARTEALPILYSRAYEKFGQPSWQLSGGVSLAQKDLFKVRTGVPLGESAGGIGKLVRRSNLDYAASSGKTLQTLKGTRFEIETVAAKARVSVAAKAETKLRARHGELATPAFERTLARTGGAVEIGTKAGGTGVGTLKIAPEKGGGFRLRWQARDIDAGNALARKMSKPGANVEGILAREPGVEAAVKLAGEGEYAVKLRGAERWMKVAPEAKPSARVAKGWDARVADIEPGSSRLQLRWVDEPAVRAEAAKGGKTLRGALGEGGGKAAEGRVVSRLEAGNVDGAAHEIARAGKEARRELDTHLADGLKAADEALASGRSFEARDALDKLIDLHGPRPELTLRKGAAELGRGRAERAARALNEGLERPLEGADPFFKEIDARLARENLPRRERASTERLAEMADWRDLQARKVVPKDRVSARVEKGKLELECRLEEPPALKAAPDAKVVAGELARGEAVLYIQDGPGLNNLDWSGSVERALGEAVSGAKLGELPRGDIGHFAPSKLYAGEQALARAPVEAPTSASGSASHYPRYHAGSGGGSDDDDDEEKKRRRRKVYLLSR